MQTQMLRERCTAYGPTLLTDAELAALAFGSSALADLVAQDGWQRLRMMTLPELDQVHGIGDVLATRIVALSEIARRMATPAQRPQITTPADAATLLVPEMAHLEQEQLRVVLLNTKNYVLKVETLYQGTIDSSPVRPCEVFRAAIRHNAKALIVAHNHPSGDPTPSPEDVVLTRQLVETGRVVEVEVLDHLVIGAGRWASLRERGLGF